MISGGIEVNLFTWIPLILEAKFADKPLTSTHFASVLPTISMLSSIMSAQRQKACFDVNPFDTYTPKNQCKTGFVPEKAISKIILY